MSHTAKSLLRLALLCGALAVIAPLPAVAAHSTAKDVPCWKRLLNDWYDGTINQTYKKQCYVQAIHHLPPEVAIYSSAKDDIQNAEQAMLAHKPTPPEHGPSLPTTTTTTTTTTPDGKTTVEVITTPITTSSPPPTTTTTKKHTGIQQAIDKITPGGPDAFPLPLLILGALAILLVLAGGAGMLWQRSHPRDEPPAPA
ncbi:MAG TPA: hypothetical protein VGM80_14865 [Gaiellaceae bacterium]